MFSVLQHADKTDKPQQTVFDKAALLDLYHLAEQINTSLPIHQRLISRRAGNQATKALGGGTDYAESRLYQPGDDRRSINWRLSARSQETFIKTFHSESRPTINILLDRRNTMLFGTRKQLKDTLALRLALILAYASDIYQLEFQAWVLSNSHAPVKFYDDRFAFMQHENHFPTKDTASNQALDLAGLLDDMRVRRPQGSLYFLISDFLDLQESHLPELVHLNEHGFTQALHIVDPAEMALPEIGRITLHDMFCAKSLDLDTRLKGDNALFTSLAQQSLNHIHNTFKQAGCVYHRLTTDTDILTQSFVLPVGNH